METQRLNYYGAAPEGIKPLSDLEAYLHGCGLEQSLLELVRLRASQLNGCAYCIDMHTKDARARGETEQRLYLLNAWREAPLYTDRERAAIAWAESVTLVSQTNVPKEVYDLACAHFTEKELVNLTLAVIAINSWNRLAVAFRKTPGTYKAAAT